MIDQIYIHKFDRNLILPVSQPLYRIQNTAKLAQVLILTIIH